MLKLLLFTMLIGSTVTIPLPVQRINTMLSFLPAIYKIEMMGYTLNGTYTFVNDSTTQTYLNYSLSHIDDRYFSPFPCTLTENIQDIIYTLNTSWTRLDDDEGPFSYVKLLTVLNGSVIGMLNEIENMIHRQG